MRSRRTASDARTPHIVRLHQETQSRKRSDKPSVLYCRSKPVTSFHDSPFIVTHIDLVLQVGDAHHLALGW